MIWAVTGSLTDALGRMNKTLGTRWTGCCSPDKYLLGHLSQISCLWLELDDVNSTKPVCLGDISIKHPWPASWMEAAPSPDLTRARPSPV